MIIINTRNNYKYKVLIIFMDYISSCRKEERERKSEKIFTKFSSSVYLDSTYYIIFI